jgi:peptidoglycan hydrolase-like protein with peptidoglycan-binding domain
VLLASSLSFAQTSATAKKPRPTPVAAKSSSQKTRAGKSTTVVHRSTAKVVKGRRSRKSASKPRGQQKIDSSRTQEIQQALIREHYLSGEPSGNFDDATQQALRGYQAANGWQSKTVPDSRALIKLGLGPDHEHLLNPESAMTMPSQTPHNAQYSSPTSDSASQDKNQQ